MRYYKSLLFTFFLFASTFTFTQEKGKFTSREKAYLFHTIRKTPIFQRHLGSYIHYSGEKPTYSNGQLKYDSVEYFIRQNPRLLSIDKYDLRRAPQGVLVELSNKMAIWELNEMIAASNDSTLKEKGYAEEYAVFVDSLLTYLPLKARKEHGVLKTDGLTSFLKNFINPNLSFEDRLAFLKPLSSWSKKEKINTIKACNKGINVWVKNTARRIFQSLGGESLQFVNVLTAAGTGTVQMGGFRSRTNKEHGWWNKGLAKPLHFFGFQPYLKTLPHPKRKPAKKEIKTKLNSIHSYQTFGKGRETRIHFDVWGYDTMRQTTAVVVKDGKYYPLFGMEHTRFLSLDTSFKNGITYYQTIHQLQDKIAFLQNKIVGKRGIDYWLNYYDKKLIKTKLEIQKAEYDLFEVRHTSYSQNSKKLKYDKRRNRKKRKDRNHNVDDVILMKDDPVKKPRAEGQNRVTFYQNQLSRIKAKIRALKKEKANILARKKVLLKKKDNMEDNIGRGNQWVCFKEQDGVAVYDDGTRFNKMTQELILPPTDTSEFFVVKLLSVPKSMKEINDRTNVMLHYSITSALPYYDAQINLHLNDYFPKNSIKTDSTAWIKKKDSVAVMEIVKALEAKKDIQIKLSANGVGVWKDYKVVKDTTPTIVTHYPGQTKEEQLESMNATAFKRLRVTHVVVRAKKDILIKVSNYTDSVKTTLVAIAKNNPKLLKNKEKYDWTNNQITSLYRVYQATEKLREEIERYAKKHLSEKQARGIIKRLDKALLKSRIKVGEGEIKYKDL